MALASINFCLLCIYALSPRFAVIKCICFGMDQWITLAHHHLHHILLSIYTSPLFLLCKLSLISPFPPRSLIFPISLPTFLFFLAPKVFEPAHHAKHYCFSENKISSLNGQRAFSALLTKSRDLNKQVLQGTKCILLSYYFTYYLWEEPLFISRNSLSFELKLTHWLYMLCRHRGSKIRANC